MYSIFLILFESTCILFFYWREQKNERVDKKVIFCVKPCPFFLFSMEKKKLCEKKIVFF
jgi:hypothetical protein